MSLEDTVREFSAFVKKLVEDCKKLVEDCEQRRQRLDAMFPIASMRAAMASEPDVLPKWPKRTRKRLTLPTGEIAEPAKGRTICTQYLRSNYNAGDVAILEKAVDAKRSWTFAEVIARKDELRRNR